MAGMTPTRTIRPILLAALLCMVCLPAAAWGPRGHRLVADIADAQLSPSARLQVQRLLQGEPDPSLAGVSTWADELRAHDPDLGRRSARWHYVNIGESQCRYRAGHDCPGGDCVVEAIRDQAAILGDDSRSDAERLQALKFVVHFVGDVHQPMHAGHARDRGGNTVQVNLPDGTRDGHGTNLHALWDSGLFRGMKESEAAQRARLERLPRDASADDREPALWAEESCRIVLQPGVYPERARIPQAYVDRWRPVAEQRIAIAGDRLAALLNDTLSR